MAKPYIPYDGPIVTRSEAINLGLTRYFTGKLCKKGHLSERNMFWQCLACIDIRGQKRTPRMKETRKLWEKNNKEKIYRQLAEWRVKNPQRWMSIIKKSSGKRRAAEGFWTEEDIEIIGEEQAWKCPGCLSNLNIKFEVDHFLPIALGGTSWPSNLQLLCMPCNRSKGAKHPIEWMASIKSYR